MKWYFSNSQIASLTSAVAETAQGECDKMLRLRNLDKALQTQLNTTGSFEDKRANKSKREDELHTWLVSLFNKSQYKPRFSVYIIEPKPNSAQRATGPQVSSQCHLSRTSLGSSNVSPKTEPPIRMIPLACVTSVQITQPSTSPIMLT